MNCAASFTKTEIQLMRIPGILLLFPAMLFGIVCFSQPLCAFDTIHAKLLKDNPSYRKQVLSTEASIQDFIRRHPAGISAGLRGSSINGAPYVIPVVVHVVHTGGAVGTIYNPTDAQITGAINYLNQVYNGTYPGIQGAGDLGVQFVLATRDTNCNASTGIDRIDGSSMTNYASNGVNANATGGVSDQTLKNFDRWDPVNYYNIWIVNKIDSNDGTHGQFIAGYAYYAGAAPTQDGTVMLATQMVSGQKTLPHEIGHALALYHPFQGSPDAATCPTNSNCATDGDAVCDTDPITYNQTGGVVDFTCRTGINACTGTAYSINTEQNYMNYTSCYTLFTAGQKARMQAAMSLPSRQSLVNSSATGSYPVSSYSVPVAASCSPATSATGTSVYGAGVMNVALAGKSFASGASKDDGGYLDKTGKCLYLVSMQNGNSYTVSANLLSINREQLAVWIDFDNNGVFSTAERVYYNADIPAPGGGNYAAVSGSFTVPNTAVTGTILRMRVMDEVSTLYSSGAYTITGPCYAPVYGQAEDYPVYLTALLPVHFDYFNGIKKGADAVLNWKTSFEENAKEFQVERSADGISFDVIGIVPATNNSAGAVYTYTDKNIPTTVNYYRLKQVDKNSQAQLSPVVIIQTSGTVNPALKVINNPFANQLDVVFNGITATGSTIHLFDVTGRLVFSKTGSIADGVVQHLDLAAAGLKPGMYILQAQVADKVMTAKVIRQ